MLRDIQDEIIRLKKENDVCILAHSYQAHEILEIAEQVGVETKEKISKLLKG